MNWERIQNLTIVFLLLACVGLGYLKLRKAEPTFGDFKVLDHQSMPINQINGSFTRLGEVLGEAAETKVLFMGLEDCEGCLYYGLELVGEAGETGSNVAIVVVHDLVSDVEIWARHYSDYKIFQVTKNHFTNAINAGDAPYWVTFEGDRVAEVAKLSKEMVFQKVQSGLEGSLAPE